MRYDFCTNIIPQFTAQEDDEKLMESKHDLAFLCMGNCGKLFNKYLHEMDATNAPALQIANLQSLCAKHKEVSA